MSKDKDKPLSPAEYEQFLGGFTEHLKKSKSKENFLKWRLVQAVRYS